MSHFKKLSKSIGNVNPCTQTVADVSAQSWRILRSLGVFPNHNASEDIDRSLNLKSCTRIDNSIKHGKKKIVARVPEALLFCSEPHNRNDQTDQNGHIAALAIDRAGRTHMRAVLEFV